MGEEVAVPEVKAKKYVTTTLDVEEDNDVIKKYTRVTKIGGFSNRDILEAGINACSESEEYKAQLREMQKELEQ